MKALLVIAMVLGVAGEARAQGGVPNTGLDGLVIAAAAVDASFAALGLVMATGTTVSLASGNFSGRWITGAYIAGGVNLAMGVAMTVVAIETRGLNNGASVGLAVGHFAIGLWNVIAPTVMLVKGSGESAGSITPVVISGRGASGKRFTGLGLQLANF